MDSSFVESSLLFTNLLPNCWQVCENAAEVQNACKASGRQKCQIPARTSAELRSCRLKVQTPGTLASSDLTLHHTQSFCAVLSLDVTSRLI